jgi:hypothetical protein
MSRWKVGYRLAPLLVALSLLAPQVTVAASDSTAFAAKGGLAGQWVALVTAHCDYTQPGSSLCGYLMPPNWTGFTDAERYHSDAQGNFTFEDLFAVTGNPVGATQPPCAALMGGQPFAGTCLITAHGTGSIQPSTFTGVHDFFIGHESVVFHAHPSITASDPFGSGFDTGYPAVRGVYDTAAYLTLVGAISPGTTPPPGVYVQMVIIHVGN